MRRRLKTGGPSLAVTYLVSEVCGLLRIAVFAHVLAPGPSDLPFFDDRAFAMLLIMAHVHPPGKPVGSSGEARDFSRGSIITVLVVALATLLTVALFMLYQTPLMEIYLADWALC